MMSKRIIGLFLAGVFCSATTAMAADAGSWYLSPGAVYVDDDEDRGVEDGFAGGQLTLGYAFHDNWNFELFGNLTDLTSDSGGLDQDILELGANLMLVPARDAAFTPFLLVGVSHVGTDYENNPGLAATSNTDNFAFSGGAGFLWNLGDSPFALRTDYRVRKEASGGDTSFSEDFTDQIVTVGVNIALGDRGPRSVDSDGDGVNDDIDRCPNTPLGATVDANGCEIDSDGDGVVDSKDQCPNTRPGAKGRFARL